VRVQDKDPCAHALTALATAREKSTFQSNAVCSINLHKPINYGKMTQLSGRVIAVVFFKKQLFS
jgi:hypothetical protein